jgi:hypothetical protein
MLELIYRFMLFQDTNPYSTLGEDLLVYHKLLLFPCHMMFGTVS